MWSSECGYLTPFKSSQEKREQEFAGFVCRKNQSLWKAWTGELQYVIELRKALNTPENFKKVHRSCQWS